MRLGKVLVGAVIITFLFVGVAGVAYSGLIMGHGMDDMLGCPLMGYAAAVCTMNPLQHLTMWQNLFATILVPSAMMLLLLLSARLLASYFNRYVWLLHPSPQHVRISYDPEVTTHDTLRRFIARGLMHPKIF